MAGRAVNRWTIPTSEELHRVRRLLGGRGGCWCKGSEAVDSMHHPVRARSMEARRFCLLGAFLVVCGMDRLNALAPWIAAMIHRTPFDYSPRVTPREMAYQLARSWRELMDWHDAPRRTFADVSSMLRVLEEFACGQGVGRAVGV